MNEIDIKRKLISKGRNTKQLYKIIKFYKYRREKKETKTNTKKISKTETKSR